MSSPLTKILRKLPATGAGGFEELVALLLERLTGQHYQLARSGSQAGRDMSASAGHTNVVAVECKRYGSRTELNERELLGEILQAQDSNPNLDLWVLVATRDLSDQLNSSLSAAAAEFGITFVPIVEGDGDPSSLEILCVQGMDIVLRDLEGRVGPEAVDKLRTLLQTIALHDNFRARLTELRESLVSPLVGYAAWRAAQNDWLLSSFASAAASRAAFGQAINVADRRHLVPRLEAERQLDSWLQEWSESHAVSVVLGEEGDGKTWAVSAWLAKHLEQGEPFPAVVFLASSNLGGTDILSQVAQTIQERLRCGDITQWTKRLQRWLVRPLAPTPLVLIVLDGVNERYEWIVWRGILEELAAHHWDKQAAVLVSCRTAYWKRYFESLSYLETAPYTIASYNDRELEAALLAHGLDFSDISAQLFPLIRKARYLDLMVRHRKRLEESGDVTPARLIYEDWKDRYERKRDHPLSDAGFQEFLQEVALQYGKGAHHLGEKELSDLLPIEADKRRLLEEFRTGQILHVRGSRYQVAEPMLVLGLGMLLIAEVELAIAEGKDLYETLAEWLEPHAGMDIKAAICESASLHALPLDRVPTKAKVVLLQAWLGSQNPSSQSEETFSAYLPLAPNCYTDLSEIMWSDAFDNAWAQQLLMRALVRWCHKPRITEHLRATFERWLGIICLHGFPHQHEDKAEKQLQAWQAINQRLDRELQPGEFHVGHHALTATTDDGLLRLSRVALAVISHLPREPFVRAISIGCLAEAVMNYPNNYDLYKWIMRSASSSLWNAVEREGLHLRSEGSTVALQALKRLLSYEGSQQAYELSQSLPSDLFPPHSLREEHAKDPCVSGFTWSRADCEQCIQRSDLKADRIALQLSTYCVDPTLQVPLGLGQRLAPLTETINIDEVWTLRALTEAGHRYKQYEAPLCAYSPRAIIDLVCRIASQLTTREGFALHQLSSHLREHILALKVEQHLDVIQVWQHLINEAPTWGDQERETEFFLFSLILQTTSAAQQLLYLISRPEEVWYAPSFERMFLPLSEWDEVKDLLWAPSTSTALWRTLWFIAAHPTILPAGIIRDQIIPLLDHDNSILRADVLKILYYSQDTNVKNSVIHSWSWDTRHTELENRWGSLLLCEYGVLLAYEELRHRIHPAYLGYAIQCRGLRSEEVEHYSSDLYLVWSQLVTAPDLPEDVPEAVLSATIQRSAPLIDRIDLDSSLLTKEVTFHSRQTYWGGLSPAPGESQRTRLSAKRLQNLLQIVRDAIQGQREAGNYWFAHEFFPEALPEVLQRNPAYLDEWLSVAFSDLPDATRRVRLAGSFYETLCVTLLQYMPAQGVRLYRRLRDYKLLVRSQDADTKLRILDCHLFAASPSTEIEQGWGWRLQRCVTDQALLEVAVLAQQGKAQSWLQECIEMGIQSSDPIRWSRAVVMLGFFESEIAREHLARLHSNQPDTWRKHLVEISHQCWRQNTWARYWFQRFLHIESDALAWAAFRLFLKVVDRRFWLWQKQAREEAAEYPHSSSREVFFQANTSTIKDGIRDNEKALRKRFLGQKTLKGQAWPWM